MIDAASAGEVYPSRAREVNRVDLYQAHANILLHEGEGKLTARLGRQEIRYGSARLMMAPGWANRRRTHDGARFIYESEDWEVNSFWVRPAIRDSSSFTTFDESNPNQQLYGIFSTYKGMERDQLDLYWLAFDLRNVGSGARYDTLASRYVGERNDWLYEIEGGVQLGTPRELFNASSNPSLIYGSGYRGYAYMPDDERLIMLETGSNQPTTRLVFLENWHETYRDLVQ